MSIRFSMYRSDRIQWIGRSHDFLGKFKHDTKIQTATCITEKLSSWNKIIELIMNGQRTTLVEHVLLPVTKQQIVLWHLQLSVEWKSNVENWAFGDQNEEIIRKSELHVVSNLGERKTRERNTHELETWRASDAADYFRHSPRVAWRPPNLTRARVFRQNLVTTRSFQPIKLILKPGIR